MKTVTMVTMGTLKMISHAKVSIHVGVIKLLNSSSTLVMLSPLHVETLKKRVDPNIVFNFVLCKV